MVIYLDSSLSSSHALVFLVLSSCGRGTMRLPTVFCSLSFLPRFRASSMAIRGTKRAFPALSRRRRDYDCVPTSHLRTEPGAGRSSSRVERNWMGGVFSTTLKLSIHRSLSVQTCKLHVSKALRQFLNYLHSHCFSLLAKNQLQPKVVMGFWPVRR